MPYDNSLRGAAARETRARILDAARASFMESGFARTTIRQVATDAGTSQETIYKTFGGKAALLKAAYDTALVGDVEQEPLSRRAEALAVRNAPTATAAVTAYAELARVIAVRVDPLLRVIFRSGGADEQLAAFARSIEGERRIGCGLWVNHWHEAGWLRADRTVEQAIDILQMLSSLENRWALQDAGWTDEAIAAWLAETIQHSILAPPDPFHPGSQ